jgi:pimeloyl-ACP methyl ester carboxylesterase
VVIQPIDRRTAPISDSEMHLEARGEGESLLLLHGGGGVGSNWDLVFPEAPPGFRLIVPDLRGHGRSTNPSKQFTVRQSARDVLALLDHLGLERVKAIGMSLGAKTLLHVATMEPERIEAMVLVSATPYFPPEARAIMETVTAETRSEAEWEQMRQWHRQGDDQIRALWSMMRGFATSYDDLSFTPPQLATIRARTLIVHGDRDFLYPVRMAIELYDAIPGAHLWIVPNGGHGPIFGAETEPFVRTSLSFLRREW